MPGSGARRPRRSHRCKWRGKSSRHVGRASHPPGRRRCSFPRIRCTKHTSRCTKHTSRSRRRGRGSSQVRIRTRTCQRGRCASPRVGTRYSLWRWRQCIRNSSYDSPDRGCLHQRTFRSGMRPGRRPTSRRRACWKRRRRPGTPSSQGHCTRSKRYGNCCTWRRCRPPIPQKLHFHIRRRTRLPKRRASKRWCT